MAKLKLWFSEEINHKEMDGRRQISEHWNVQSKRFLIGNFVDSDEMQRQKIPLPDEDFYSVVNYY